MKEEVYISFTKSAECCKDIIKLGDVAEIWCSDNTLMSGIKNVVLASPKENQDRVYVFTAILVVRILLKEYPDININCLGASEFAVVYRKSKNDNKLWNIIKIVLVSLIVVAGGAFAIMAYGNDVDIQNVFETITEYIAGDAGKNVRIIQIAYSVGLSLGIITFFNNFGSRRKLKDPTPMQVSMRTYEEDLYTSIIDSNMREGKIGDVD